MSNTYIKLDQNIFECIDEIAKINQEHPGYFDLDYGCNLLDKIDKLNLKFNNLWYKRFLVELYNKSKELNNYKGKILVLNGVKGLYTEALLRFLKNLNIGIDILDFTNEENFYNFFKLISRTCTSNNKLHLRLLSEKQRIDYNRYDLIVSVGPTYLLMDLLEDIKLKAKLVFIDFAFFSAMVDYVKKLQQNQGDFFQNKILKQNRPLLVYSCQRRKYHDDFDQIFNPKNVKLKFFDYIPAYIKSFPNIRNKKYIFDILILGDSRRNFNIIYDALYFFKKKKILFRANKYAEEINELKNILNIKIMPRVKHDLYVKLFAVSKIVFIPTKDDSKNVFISIADALAMGKAVITSASPGISQVIDYKKEKPLIAIENKNQNEFIKEIAKLLSDDNYRKDYEKRALAYARNELNIDLIFFRIFRDLFKYIS